MNDHQIAFIICTNDSVFLNESLLYLSLLDVPEGFTTDIITIEGADSMCAGYNAAMKECDAKYKVYMHHDVLITDHMFLHKLLDIFDSDERIGMIGVAGAPRLDINAIMWEVPRVGNLSSDKLDHMDFGFHEDQIIDVDCIDGLLMATQANVPWREDIFTGFHFYDVSQSFEFHRHGYRVVVKDVKDDAIIHDCGVPNMLEYEKYRQLCIKEYGDLLYPVEYLKSHGIESGKDFWITIYQNRNSYRNVYNDAENFVDNAIKNKDISLFTMFSKMVESEMTVCRWSERVSNLYRISQIVIRENNDVTQQPGFLDGVQSAQEALSKFQICKQMIMRQMNHLPEMYEYEADTYLSNSVSNVARSFIQEVVKRRLE